MKKMASAIVSSEWAAVIETTKLVSVKRPWANTRGARILSKFNGGLTQTSQVHEIVLNALNPC